MPLTTPPKTFTETELDKIKRLFFNQDEYFSINYIARACNTSERVLKRELKKLGWTREKKRWSD